MKLTKLFRTLTFFIAGFLAFSCNNVFHELIPPADSSIHSFSLQDPETGFSRNAVPYSEAITITVPYGTDITALIPVIKTDEKATVIPGTLPYIHKAFPSANIVNLSLQMQLAYNSGDLGSWVLNFIQENRDFTVPQLDIPIDFSEPVVFCVIAGQGNYSLYTVSVVIEEPENPGDPSTPQEPEDPQEPEEPETELPKDILSFTVENQLGTSVITQNTVSFTMDDGADIRGLYPVISVSPGAKVLPLTTDYLLDMFTYDQLISLLTGISTSVKPETYIKSFLEKQNNPEIPNLTHRIDFTQPVIMAVIAQDNSIKLYTVTCTVQKDEPALTNLAFTKYNNPGLMKDARVSISGNTVTVEATYPVEYPDYDLIPDVSFYGDKITCTLPDGTETQINPGETKLSFGVTNITNGETVSSLLTVYKNGKTTQYNLNITWQEDKDTIRSITDFRFTKNTNPEIGTLSMASIYNEGDTGYISAVILYEGTTAPYELIPDFYSPGTVTKDNAVQTSGVTKQNYQTSFEYLCTSKNGLYCRLYTVNVTFIKVEPAQALIKSFSFPKFLNPDLSLDSEGVIDQDSATIYLSVKYKSQNPPEKLTAQFGATGNVLVDNIPQSSGFTEQDFKYTQYYTVISKNEISTATKTYKIQVVFTRDEDSDCALVSFGFLKQDNPTMDKDIEATITERSGSVYALLPKGTDFAGIPLIPVFETKGTLTVNGSTIQSGTTPVNFGEEVKLTVTSKNGLFTKEYTVLLQESGAVIYVDLRACGRNNGTSWEDAFISFDRAIEAANAIPADSVIEIYLTENDTPYTYDSDAYPLERANLIIRGGFTGNETTPEERPMITNAKGNLVPEHKTMITNDNNLTFICHNQTGGSLTFDSLDLIYGRSSIGLLDLSISKTAQSQPQVNYQNCRIKYAYNKFGIDIDNNSKKDIDITFTDTEISVDVYSSFITHDGTSLVNTVIKDSTFKIPGLYCDANSSNLEIINSDITNSSTSSFSLYCSNIVARDSTFNGGKGTMSGKLKTNSQIAEYYNCTLNEVNGISCTVMEDCTITNTLGKTYASSLISSLGNTRITRTRIDSNTKTGAYGLIGFTGNDYDNYDVEITDSHINSTDPYFLKKPCNLTIRGTGADSSSCTISTSLFFYSWNLVEAGSSNCSVIIENAQIHTHDAFNYPGYHLLFNDMPNNYKFCFDKKFYFNELKILDSQITSDKYMALPLCNSTVIKNSTLTSKNTCQISYVHYDVPVKPENLEITSSTIQGSHVLIGQGVNTVIKDNKITTPTDEYTYVKIYLSDNTDVCGLNNRNYEFQGNTIDSNETAISFYPPIENIKLNNNNFSNYTFIYTNKNTAPDLFEFNGNSLNTTREITSSTGDIIDAYYGLSLDGLPAGGTAINCENSNIGYIYLRTSDYNTDYAYATFKNCIIDESFYSGDTDNLVYIARNFDVLFQDCIFNTHYRKIRGTDETKILIKGTGTNTSMINRHSSPNRATSILYEIYNIQNTVINVTIPKPEEEEDWRDYLGWSGISSSNFDNCTFNISLERDFPRFFGYCNSSNCTFNISIEENYGGSIFMRCNLSNSTLNVSSEAEIDTLFSNCNLSNSTFDGKNIYGISCFMRNTGSGEYSITNCIITNIKVSLVYDQDQSTTTTIDSSEIRSCSGGITINGDINNSQIFNYDCSEQNNYYIICYGDITDSSIYGRTTEFYGEKIQNTSFNFCITTFRGGAVKIKGKKTLIENCVFSHCETTAQASDVSGGGAIAIECNANNIEVTIKNSRFNNNKTSMAFGKDIFMCAEWGESIFSSAASYSGCVLDLQNCYSDYVTDYGLVVGNSLSVYTVNVTKKGNMLAL